MKINGLTKTFPWGDLSIAVEGEELTHTTGSRYVGKHDYGKSRVQSRHEVSSIAGY